MLFIWPLIVMSLSTLLVNGFFSFSSLIIVSFCSVLAAGLIFGCGARYRYRGINPSTRNPINYNDGHYFERIGADESDYT